MVSGSMRTQILNILIAKHDQTAGHCGTTLAQITNQVKGTKEEIKNVLIQLAKDKIVTGHDGPHGRIIKIVK